MMNRAWKNESPSPMFHWIAGILSLRYNEIWYRKHDLCVQEHLIQAPNLPTDELYELVHVNEITRLQFCYLEKGDNIFLI